MTHGHTYSISWDTNASQTHTVRCKICQNGNAKKSLYDSMELHIGSEESLGSNVSFFNEKTSKYTPAMHIWRRGGPKSVYSESATQTTFPATLPKQNSAWIWLHMLRSGHRSCARIAFSSEEKPCFWVIQKQKPKYEKQKPANAKLTKACFGLNRWNNTKMRLCSVERAVRQDTPSPPPLTQLFWY